MRLFLFCLFITTVLCEDLQNDQNITTTPNPNRSIETFQITQPTQPSSQTQQIEQTINVAASSNITVSPSDNSSKDSKSKSAFKPSPHLETYYEYNKFPVPPAFPEAKQIHSWNTEEFPLQQWPPKDIATTTDTNQWTARVKFPEAIVPTIKDRPYQFYKEKSANEGKSFAPPSKKPYGLWDKFEKRPIMPQHQFDFTAPVKIPPTSIHKSHYPLVENKQHEMGHHGNPWKKIIKLLTAFIPIGLLISALTPTVITVSTVNGTQTRSRAEDGNKEFVSSLTHLANMNSLGCEDRILCELLLTATTSANAEHHVKNLLDTFAKGGKAIERADDMKKVFDAVKNQDCSPIICKSIPENT